MSRVFIVGSGSVGAATGRALGHAGHRVTFVDIDPRRVAVLVNEGLDARRDLDLAGEPESFVFICTPTRIVAGRHHLADVAAGSEAVGRALAHADAVHTVIVRSTVPPGTTRDLVRPLVELHSGRRDGTGFHIVASPHFDTRSGASRSGRHAMETVRPQLTVIGAENERVNANVRDLLSPLMSPGGQLRLLDDPAEAEMIKCAHSLFNATKISFWNEIWRVCDRLGLDPDDVASTVATSVEGSLNPEYGIWGGAPYGGAQLPGDTQGFLGFAEEIGLPMPLLSAVVGVNSGFEQRLDAEMEALSMLASGPYYYAPEYGRPPRSAEPYEPYETQAPYHLEQHYQPETPRPAAEFAPPVEQYPPLEQFPAAESYPAVEFPATEPVRFETPATTTSPVEEAPTPEASAEAGELAGGEVQLDPGANHPSRRAQRRSWIPRQLGR
ncbi:2-dehydropantoate 2-reductase N-terminal domain-containing protein [Kineosporia succinea]|uniref:UDP-glucose 6-dehydrogenase n=1 Tax=Kineosporia succinea TaxID=84632 RepID=A0ABT9P4D9_9ACTN|nr:2-dehydropantoate 2-reductase N-terminal domain-containing protein [Kineosporia succinea]MDP9827560.1 UDPglucose 6-dehydrogenase [Kineosporia succinea]